MNMVPAGYNNFCCNRPVLYPWLWLAPAHIVPASYDKIVQPAGTIYMTNICTRIYGTSQSVLALPHPFQSCDPFVQSATHTIPPRYPRGLPLGLNLSCVIGFAAKAARCSHAHGPGLVKVVSADSSPVEAPVIPHNHRSTSTLVKPTKAIASAALTLLAVAPKKPKWPHVANLHIRCGASGNHSESPTGAFFFSFFVSHFIVLICCSAWSQQCSQLVM